MEKFPKDLIGLKFTKLVVINRLDYRNGNFYWECLCECGNIVEVSRSNLTRNNTKSCGCLRKIPRTDTLQRKFGRLKPIRYLENKKYECLCDCGNIIIVNGALLRKGHTKSCGCLTKDKTNLVGLRFDRLLVIEKIIKNNKARLKCVCDCGKIIETCPNRLVNKKTRSCGCLARELSIQRGKLLKKEKHPCWNHELSKEERECSQNRSLNPELKQWRNAVYRKDKFTCNICKDNRGKNLNAHHLFAWNKYKNLRFDINNGITLCNKCHTKFHKLYGSGNNTLEQFLEFKEKITNE